MLGGAQSIKLRSWWFFLLGVVFFTAAPALAAVESKSINKTNAIDKTAVTQKAVKLQLPFIENQGQIKDKSVRYYAKTFGGTAYVGDEGEIVYAILPDESITVDKPSKKDSPRRLIIREQLVGSDINPPKGIERAATKIHCFIGNDRRKWKSNLPTYKSVSLGEVYKGINLSLKAYSKTVGE